MKNYFVFAIMFLALVGCGKNSTDDNQTTAIPPGPSCVQANGYGYGCNTGAYPSGFSAYPMNNGYYSGYGYPGYYNTGYYNSCGYGSVAAYSPTYGLGCVQSSYPANYYYGYGYGYNYATYRYGGYNALMYCAVGVNSCGNGAVCRSASPGLAYGFCVR